MTTQKKTCTECGVEKSVSDFYKKRGGKLGVRSKCKICTRNYNKQYYQENKESKRQYNKQYYKQYYQENKERIKQYKEQYNKQYYRENKERIKQYYQENKEHKKQYMKELYEINPQYKISVLIRVRTRRLVKSGKAKKFCGYNEYIGCSPEELVKHIESQFHRHPSTGEDMTWDNHGEWHIDHIRPLASFDLTQEEDFMQAHHYTNLQPLWAEENLSKGANWDEV